MFPVTVLCVLSSSKYFKTPPIITGTEITPVKYTQLCQYQIKNVMGVSLKKQHRN